jgi:hypothetical protein
MIVQWNVHCTDLQEHLIWDQRLAPHIFYWRHLGCRCTVRALWSYHRGPLKWPARRDKFAISRHPQFISVFVGVWLSLRSDCLLVCPLYWPREQTLCVTYGKCPYSFPSQLTSRERYLCTELLPPFVSEEYVSNDWLVVCPPLATTIQNKRYGLVCKGNPTFESCEERKSWGREIQCTLGVPNLRPQR